MTSDAEPSSDVNLGSHGEMDSDVNELKESSEKEDSSASISRKSIDGGLSNIAGKLFVNAVGIVVGGVLARILSPNDFGLLAKVTALTGIAGLLNNLGVSLAVIQSKTLSDRQMSGLFWVNFLMTSAVSALLCLLSFAIAAFYGDPRVFWISIALAGVSFIAGIGVMHRSILERRLQFHFLAIISIVAVSCSGIVAVCTAHSIGYWALILQLFTASLISTVGLWIATGFRPSLQLRGTGIRQMVLMGGNFTLAGMINYFARNADNILIGRFCGESALGFYSKSYSLLLLPLNQIATPLTRVAVPILSRFQDDESLYRAYFLRGNAISMAIQIPVTLFAMMGASEIILTVLGPKWVGCIPIFYAFVPALYLSTTVPASRWVVHSLGETKRFAKVVAINSFVKVLGFWIALPYGAFGVACSFSISSCICRIPAIFYFLSLTPVKPRDFFGAMLLPTAYSVVACVPTYAVGQFTVGFHPSVGLVAKAIVYFSCYLLLISTSNVGRDMNRLLRERLINRKQGLEA